VRSAGHVAAGEKMTEYGSNIINLLPPIATSFGVIPFLIKGSPIVLEKEIRNFVIAIYLIIIWLAFICASMLSLYFFFPVILTIAALSLGVILFFWVFFLLISKTTTKEKNQGKLTAFYALGIFFVTIGFTNYAANKGKVALHVENSKEVYNVEVLCEERAGAKEKTFPFNMRRVPFKGDLGCIIDAEKFSKIKKVTVYFLNENSEKVTKDIEISTLNFRETGLGGDYVIRF
jgi:hypothetical protein